MWISKLGNQNSL